jgi:cell shape-determining protein MreC
MKMMYQIKHTDQNFFSRNFLKILAIFLLIVTFVFLAIFSSSVHSLIADALSPLLKTGNFFYQSLDKIPKFFFDKNKLINENTNLSFETESLNLTIADYQSLKDENDKLREELNIKPAGNFIGASVIAKSPQIPLDSLFLDKGAADGISNGDLVLASDRTLIGKIVDVSKNRSTVSLNSFAGVVSYGFVGRTNEPIQVSGIGGGSIQAKMPIDFDIVVGDKIMVGGSLNYFAAIVGVIENDSSSGFKNILMSLPVDVSKISIVFIEPNTNE